MRELIRRLHYLLTQRRRDAELAEEMAFHAERSGRRAFGNTTLAREDARAVWIAPWLESIWQDAAYAIRNARRQPAFSLAVVATIALGIGANSAIFSIANAVLLRPLHTTNADRIVRLTETYKGAPSWIVGLRTFNVWQQAGGFDDVSAHWLELANLTQAAFPEQVPVARVSGRFFALFHAPVLKGRTFSQDEDRPGAAAVAVLSEAVWRRQFGADSEIVDKTILIAGERRTIVGVLDGGFDSEQFDQRPDVWVPFQIDPVAPDRGPLCFVTARLPSGVSLDAANAGLKIAADEWRRQSAQPANAAAGFVAVPLREAMVGDARGTILLLSGAVALVLLIACANVAGLLLVRATARRREMAVRAAIGAGRGRLVRQLMTESLVLTAAGGVLGLFGGLGVIRVLLAAHPGNNPFVLGVSAASLPRLGSNTSTIPMDAPVLAFTASLTVVAGFLFGLVPALSAGRSDLVASLRTGGRDASGGAHITRTRALLVVGEVAIAVTLLIGSGLLIRTNAALFATRRGFDLDGVLIARTSVKGTAFETRAGISRLTLDATTRLEALPGVVVAGSACCVPLETVWQLPFVIAGRPLTGAFHAFAGWTFVSPGYFEALRIPILRGRAFTPSDDAGAPGVAIINETMARRFWPDGDPLGERLLIGRSLRPEYRDDPVRQIIAIAADVRDQALNKPPRPAMYVPIAQVPDGVTALNVRLLPLTWIVRTNREPRDIARSIQRELEAATGGLPVTNVRSMTAVAADSIARVRFDMLLMTTFGGAALLLAGAPRASHSDCSRPFGSLGCSPASCLA